MKIYALAAALFLLPSMATAALQPNDFAYGMPLSLKDNGAIYRLRVPADVYQTVTRGDLGDIRVFNKAQAAVPYVLRRPEQKNEIHEQKKSLPFFPLYTKKNVSAKDSLSVRVEKREDGTILNIHSNGAAREQDQKLTGYIIDASAHKEAIDALDISWQTQEASFVTTISLEHSTDLTHWSRWVPRTTLARMTFHGHQIKRERIELSSKAVTYIRLRWPNDRTALNVNDIVAVQRSDEEARPHLWKALKGQSIDLSDATDKEMTTYVYDANAQLPVDRVRLNFVEKNTLVSASLYSRPDQDAQWRFRKKAIFYDLSFDGSALVQDTVWVGQTSDRHWRMDVAKGALGDAQNAPTMALGWLPHDLLFTARGKGPFLMAYGSARLGENAASNATPDLLQVIGDKEQGLLKEATALPRTVLGGPELLTPEPPPLPWRKWLLWGVLMVGVGFIAWMAVSLTKGMNKEKV